MEFNVVALHGSAVFIQKIKTRNLHLNLENFKDWNPLIEETIDKSAQIPYLYILIDIINYTNYTYDSTLR